MEEKYIPDIVIARLPLYLQALNHLKKDGGHKTSSQAMAEMIGISAAQIRKDLSFFGEFGKQGSGYSVDFLIDQLQKILKVNRVWDIVLIGVGDLGRAIAHYQGFENAGFRITHIFDNNPKKIGTEIAGYTIHGMDELPELIQINHIEVAMLTVPSAGAQTAADALIKAGIRAILNYAPITLYVPESVKVQYINPILELQHMTYYLE
ncbi:MAG: redox-sensing transcriptional repressor Rex [Anaerolineaceae bacterium]